MTGLGVRMRRWLDRVARRGGGDGVGDPRGGGDAEGRRNEDIRRADRGAEDAWRRAALDTIRRVAEDRPELTTDDVLQANPALELGREKRALGPMMLYAARDGLIAPTERYAASSRRASNARHKRVWRSLVHGGSRPRPEGTAGLEILEALR